MRSVLLGLLLLPLTAHGFGQTVLGTRLQVTNPGAPSARKVTVKAKETNSDDTVLGDPTTGGAEIVVTLEGVTPTSQTFLLVAGTSTATGKPFWSGDAAHGFIYADTQGRNGPVVAARIRLAKGTFLITAKISGKGGAVSVVPPNPGSSGCVTFRILGGDIYSVSFATGRVVNHGARLFRVSRPTAEGLCAGAVTTTSTSSTTSTTVPHVCGNGVIEPPAEECDGDSFCTATCDVQLYACCSPPPFPSCTGECYPFGRSCFFGCSPNPVYIGSHASWSGPCPGAMDGAALGTGTCAPPEAVAASVCCPLSGGGCFETAVANTADLQSAVLDCGINQGTNPLIGTCVAGSCVPAH